MAAPIIQVRNLGKAYRLGAQAGLQRTLPEAVADGVARLFRRSPRTTCNEPFWALRNVSFDVAEGEVVGIIGHNGAGKSTLLKILSQITDPTEGEAILRGRVASLLEVGTGFHPELTGRENIYLNGAVLGMNRREIARKFDAIVDFSGVEAFLDTPVKRYSSGMTVRLAFAVAAHLEPEILVVDEVLAVGDASFQRKCLGKMSEVSRSGRTVLFVSHNMDSIMSLCRSALVMHQGRLSCYLPVQEGVKHYFELLRAEEQRPLIERTRRSNMDHPPVFRDIRITGEQGEIITCGGSVTFDIELSNMTGVHNGQCAISVTNEQGQRLVTFQSAIHSDVRISGISTGRVRCHIPSLLLIPGTYYVDLCMADHPRIIDYVERAASFEVVFADILKTGRLPTSQHGRVVLPCQWKLAA